jgi:hypothetical protein
MAYSRVKLDAFLKSFVVGSGVTAVAALGLLYLDDWAFKKRLEERQDRRALRNGYCPGMYLDAYDAARREGLQSQSNQPGGRPAQNNVHSQVFFDMDVKYWPQSQRESANLQFSPDMDRKYLLKQKPPAAAEVTRPVETRP